MKTKPCRAACGSDVACISMPFLRLARCAARVAISTGKSRIWDLANQLQMRAYGRKICRWWLQNKNTPRNRLLSCSIRLTWMKSRLSRLCRSGVGAGRTPKQAAFSISAEWGYRHEHIHNTGCSGRTATDCRTAQETRAERKGWFHMRITLF